MHEYEAKLNALILFQSSTPVSKSTSVSREVSPRDLTIPMPDVVTTLPSPQSGSPSTVKKRHSTGEMADRLKARSMLILPDPTRFYFALFTMQNSRDLKHVV